MSGFFLGLWIFLSVYSICDTYTYLQGFNTFFWKYKTKAELRYQDRLLGMKLLSLTKPTEENKMATAKRVFKTKKILSGVRTEYRAWKEWDEGDVLIAKYTGSSQNRKNKSKKDWIVEPIDAFFADKKEQKRVLAAKILTLNSAGQMDKGMQQLEEGDIFQVTYNGSKVMEGGEYAGDTAHTMEVVQVEEEGDEDFGDNDDEENEDEEDL